MRLPILAVGQPEIMDLIKDHEDVFTGIGKLKGVTVKLRVGNITSSRSASIIKRSARANADFIESFVQVTAPIRDLIIKGTPKSQRAFTQTRTKLSGDTVMGYFNPHQKIKLMTEDPRV